MRKIFYPFIFLLVFNNHGQAQTKPDKISARDSMEILGELMNLLDSSDKTVSYVFANIGIGNRLFSINNYALNAKQSNTKVVIYSPSVAYFHKSGFSITAGANLLNDVTGFGVNQYSVIPAFDLTGDKNIAFGISFAHYFVNNKFSSFSSPVQNDLYTSLKYKRSWVQPGIALGYSTGDYREARYKDTAITNIRKYFYDSVTNKLKAFSLMFSAGHQFSWYGIFSQSDGLALTSTLMANAGSTKTAIHHKTNAAALFNFLNKKGRIPKFQNTRFEMQSLGLNLDVSYTTGDFTFEPQLYSDYYLPATESKRFTQVFVFNIGYSF